MPRQGLADLASQLRTSQTYALPMSRGAAPTGAAPYAMPTEVSAPPMVAMVPAVDPLAMPPEESRQTPRRRPVRRKKPDTARQDAERLQRISQAVVYSPTPVVDWSNSPPTMVPIAKTGLVMRPDAHGNIPIAFDVARLQPGDIEWMQQQQEGKG